MFPISKEMAEYRTEKQINLFEEDKWTIQFFEMGVITEEQLLKSIRPELHCSDQIDCTL